MRLAIIALVTALVAFADGQDCIGLAGRACRDKKACSFNKGVCFVTETGESSSSSPPPPPAAAEGECGALSAKVCRKTDGCSYDKSSKSCVDNGEVPTEVTPGFAVSPSVLCMFFSSRKCFGPPIC